MYILILTWLTDWLNWGNVLSSSPSFFYLYFLKKIENPKLRWNETASLAIVFSTKHEQFLRLGAWVTRYVGIMIDIDMIGTSRGCAGKDGCAWGVWKKWQRRWRYKKKIKKKYVNQHWTIRGRTSPCWNYITWLGGPPQGRWWTIQFEFESSIRMKKWFWIQHTISIYIKKINMIHPSSWCDSYHTYNRKNLHYL